MSTSVLAIVSLVVAVAVLPSHALPQRLPSPTASFGSSAGLATTNDWPTLRTESLFDFVTALGEEPRLVRSSDIKAALKNQSTSVYQQLQAILRDLPNDPLNAYWTTATSLANPFKSALDIRSKGHRAVRQLKGKVPNPSTLLESGHTFVMRFEQLPLVQSDPVAKLTHFLEQITGLPVTIHAYVSGPTDVALNPHTDNYDVLVYHAQHKKHWTVSICEWTVASWVYNSTQYERVTLCKAGDLNYEHAYLASFSVRFKGDATSPLNMSPPLTSPSSCPLIDIVIPPPRRP
eukprot:m.252563 g.252563  ORF g.252563 m.252563 type:complete len:290 (-) comp15473_c6_seq2:11458-12327(-)